MLDIIFISYDEPNADSNFDLLRSRFPFARRVHGVKGIAHAHNAAAKKAMTKFFYVVDGDAVIRPDFDFSFVPQVGEEDFVHIWHAYNPVGLEYGYGGVKLFKKSFFKDVKSYVDFSTSLTKDVKIHPEIACETRFNSDPARAFRSGFREAAKLRTTTMDESKSFSVREEATLRLCKWLQPLPCDYQEFIIKGAVAGVEFADSRKGDIADMNMMHDTIFAVYNK
jgi:hypothetical protein